jgi:glycine/D-amino acid oxidase-like deaminating enzyme
MEAVVQQSDFVVVGGGIAGASVAFGLVTRGVAVALIDDARIGLATAAGAGIIQPWASATTGAFYELQAAGAAHYPLLLARLDDLGITDVGYRRTGALVVNASTDVLDTVEARVRDRARSAADVGEISRVESERARELWPPLAAELAGLHIGGGARVDGRLLCAGLIEAVRRLGGQVIHGTARLEVSPTSRVVTCDEMQFAAGAIVIAGGAWTTELAETLGVPLGLEPQRGQISHLHLPGFDTSGWPSLSPQSDHYMVAFDGGRVVVGATRETGSGFDPRVTAHGQRHVLDNALTLSPGLGAATLLETRVGLRPMAADGFPIIGTVGAHPSVYVATGFGPIGLTVGPYVGDQVGLRLVNGEWDPNMDAFAPRPVVS